MCRYLCEHAATGLRSEQEGGAPLCGVQRPAARHVGVAAERSAWSVLNCFTNACSSRVNDPSPWFFVVGVLICCVTCPEWVMTELVISRWSGCLSRFGSPSFTLCVCVLWRCLLQTESGVRGVRRGRRRMASHRYTFVFGPAGRKYNSGALVGPPAGSALIPPEVLRFPLRADRYTLHQTVCSGGEAALPLASPRQRFFGLHQD